MELKIFSKIFTGFLLFFFLFVSFYSKADAASGSMSVIPKSGQYKIGDLIEASIHIDGAGTAFNAAKANIAVSQNLKIENLTLGDCGFAFIQTPTVNSPRFTGVLLGSSKNSCNVMTLTLKVTGPNNAFVYISDGSIKAYKGAGELLNNVVNSSYTIASNSQNQGLVSDIQASPTQPPLSSTTGEKMYSLTYTISADTSKASDLTVVLDPNTPSEMDTSPAPATLVDKTILSAVFDNVPEGVHTIEVRDKGNVVSSEVITLNGDNRDISLGVKPSHPVFSLFNIAVTALILIFLISSGMAFYIFYWRKRHIPS